MFANLAVATVRALTETFSGIRPVDLPGFVIAQFADEVGLLVAIGCETRRYDPSGLALPDDAGPSRSKVQELRALSL